MALIRSYRARGLRVSVAAGLAAAAAAFGASVALAQGGPPQAVLSSLQAAGSNGLQVTGSVSTNGSDTSFVIQYGTSPSLGDSTQPTDVGAAGTGSCGCQPIPIQQPIFGLSPDTHYYVRIAATNGNGTAYSQTLSAWTQTPQGQPGGPSGSASPGSAKDELVVRPLPRVGLPYVALIGVSCPSSSFCMAVGSFGSGASTGSFFERFNGRSWRRIDVQRGPHWLAVSCLSESFCLAVGTADRSTRVVGQGWNGRSWSRVSAFSPPASAPEPGANPGEGLQSLSCATRSDCWAVGYAYGRTLVEHWNGRSFTRSAAPVRNGNLISVSCSSARDCSAANTGLGTGPPAAPLHFNGHAWQIARLPGSFTRRRYYDQEVSCRMSSSCWIVGSSSATGSQPAALQRVGSSWRMLSMPAPHESSGTLQGLDCGSSSDCWALGSASVGAPLPKSSPLAEQWDGSAWQIATVIGPAKRTPLTSVSCPTAAFCIAVGGSAFAVTRPVQ